METVSKLPLKLQIRNYFLLTKPGIIFGNGVSAIGGFLLSSKGHFNIALFLAMFLGLSLVIASGCSFNNYIDRDIDARMNRTKNRALVKGLIPVKNAIVYAVALLFLGLGILLLFTNLITALLAFIGFVIYVVFYSFFKHVSSHATLVGSLAGAVPPVVGYTAVTGQLDLGACILFAIFAMWQMPHFFAIALYRLEDYKGAEIPVLPVRKGIVRTKVEMFLFVIGFVFCSVLLYVFQYTNLVFLVVIGGAGLFWLYLSVKGFFCQSDQKWARKMFIFSLVVVMAITIVIPFSIV